MNRLADALCGRHVLRPAFAIRTLLQCFILGKAVTAISTPWSMWKGRRSTISSNVADESSQRSLWKLRARSPPVWPRSMNTCKDLTLPRGFGWEAGLFLLGPQTSEDVQHSGHERIWARVRPERYGLKRWNIRLERPEDHPPCRQFLR